MKYFWALFLIFLGIVLLGAEVGAYSSNELRNVARLWPVFLIILGIDLLFKKARYGYVVTTLLMLIVFGGIIAYLFYGWLPSCLLIIR